MSLYIYIKQDIIKIHYIVYRLQNYIIAYLLMHILEV